MPQDDPTEIDPRQWRPFLRLGEYLSKEFLVLAEEWLFLVREYGTSKSESRPATKEQFLEFTAHVHDGWKDAQRRIADFLIDALARRSAAEAHQKEQHRLKSKEGKRLAREDAARIGLEISVARRMLDVILWTIFAGDHSTLRRLHVDGGEHNLSTANIVDAMKAADHFNNDAQVMALSTDMLSFVHVGDLILANRAEGSISFIELKAGEKNVDIAQTAEVAVQSECEYFEALATSGYNETDRKHYERVKRQAKRNDTIVSTIRNEGGTDPNTGSKVVIQPTPDLVEHWSEDVMRCYESLNESKKWAISVIDECVYVGVYSDQRMAFVGFQAWMKQQGCESRIFSLTDSFRDPGVRPLGATFLSLDLQKKILRGEILVIMCLDILRMIDLANKLQPGYLQLATKTETVRMRGQKVGDFTLNGLFIRANVAGEVTFLGGGFRDRVLFDQQRPAQLLSQHLAMAPLATREQP